MSQILIFTGGSPQNQAILEELPEPDLVVAADSGYDVARDLDFDVDILIGDLDSISAELIPRHVLVEKHDRDKEESDLELALSSVAQDAPDRVVVVGGSGGRLDHELTTAALLTSQRWSRIGQIDWVNDRGWGYVVTDKRILHGDIGSILTLIPMGGDAIGVRTTGLRWDLAGETLYHGSTRGLSNLFIKPAVEVSVDHGTLLAVIPASD